MNHDSHNFVHIFTQSSFFQIYPIDTYTEGINTSINQISSAFLCIPNHYNNLPVCTAWYVLAPITFFFRNHDKKDSCHRVFLCNLFSEITMSIAQRLFLFHQNHVYVKPNKITLGIKIIGVLHGVP